MTNPAVRSQGRILTDVIPWGYYAHSATPNAFSAADIGQNITIQGADTGGSDNVTWIANYIPAQPSNNPATTICAMPPTGATQQFPCILLAHASAATQYQTGIPRTAQVAFQNVYTSNYHGGIGQPAIVFGQGGPYTFLNNTLGGTGGHFWSTSGGMWMGNVFPDFAPNPFWFVGYPMPPGILIKGNAINGSTAFPMMDYDVPLAGFSTFPITSGNLPSLDVSLHKKFSIACTAACTLSYLHGAVDGETVELFVNTTFLTIHEGSATGATQIHTGTGADYTPAHSTVMQLTFIGATNQWYVVTGAH
jgi:hypothetical protein